MPTSSAPRGLPTRRGSSKSGPVMNSAAAAAISAAAARPRRGEPGARSPVRTFQSRRPTITQQGTCRLGAVHHVTVLHCLPGLGQGAECFRIRPHLGRFPQRQKGLDGEHDSLVDAAMVFLRGKAKLRLELRVQP